MRPRQESNLGPQSTGKRYSEKDLKSFYKRAEARYEELFPQVKLQRFVSEFKTQSHTKEAVTALWSNMWKVMDRVTGTRVTVAECDRTNKEIAELEANGRMLVYVPKELSEVDQAKHLLPLVLPDLKAQKASNLSSDDFTNIVEQSGWVSIEATARLPHSRAEDEVTIRDSVESGELQGQTINTYLIGTFFSKLLNGVYFDEGDLYHPYTAIILGSRKNETHDGKPVRYLPYARCSTDREGNISNLSFWSYWGDISPRQIRTAEPKNQIVEKQDRRKYYWNMNVLHTPPTSEAWNQRLESDTGGQVAELLRHIHEPEQILPLSKPVEDVDVKIRQALKQLGVDIRAVSTLSIGELQTRADRKDADYQTRYGTWERRKTPNEKLADYLSIYVLDKYLDHLVWDYVKQRYDVTKAVRIDIDFFDKLWKDGVQDRFAHRSGATGFLWRTFRQVIGYEIDLLAAGKPQDAAKLSPLRELCEAGNYPIGIDKSGLLLILTA